METRDKIPFGGINRPGKESALRETPRLSPYSNSPGRQHATGYRKQSRTTPKSTSFSPVIALFIPRARFFFGSACNLLPPSGSNVRATHHVRLHLVLAELPGYLFLPFNNKTEQKTGVCRISSGLGRVSAESAMLSRTCWYSIKRLGGIWARAREGGR